MSGQIGVNLSICLTDIPKELITKAKNGKSYVNLTSFIASEKGQYGDNGGVTLPQTKEQRDAKDKKVYVGNAKLFWSNGEGLVVESEPQQAVSTSIVEEVDDLPF